MFRYVISSLIIALPLSAQAIDFGHMADFDHQLAPWAAMSARSDLNIDSVLQTLSEQENRALPRMVSGTMRFDKVTAQPGKRLVRHYTLLDYRDRQASEAAFATYMSKHEICADPRVAMYVKYGVGMTYQYQNLAGQEIGKVQVAPSDCKNPV